jgi:hypothetical protein
MSLRDITTDEITNFRESPENLARNQPQNLIFQIIHYGLSLLLMDEEDILELLHKFIVLLIEWKIQETAL